MKIIVPVSDLHVASNTRGIGVYSRQLITAMRKYFPGDSISHEGSGDIVHYHFFDPFVKTLKIDEKVPTVVTVHDLIPLRFPQHFPVGIRGKYAWWRQKRALSKVSHIITDSESSKADIIDIGGISPTKITVIPLGPNHTQKVGSILTKKIANSYSLPKKYLLYVGDINWNKNVVGLIDAFTQLKRSDLSLVLVGKVFSDRPDIPEYRAIEAAIARSSMRDQIIQIGFVPSHHLSVFYSLATLYVQPSWYEGFGLPLLEAMKFGSPVASANTGSLPEVGGDAVAYFDPSKGMAKVIAELLSDTARLKTLASLGILRAKDFTWKKTAGATRAVYEHVVSQSL